MQTTEQSTTIHSTKLKLIFLGDINVGKTSIIERFAKQEFDPLINPTIGIDFLIRTATYDKKIYRIQLWDTAGQQKFRSLVPAYMKDADCAVFVVDVGRIKTLQNLNIWVQLYEQNRRKDKAIAVLLANKVDGEMEKGQTRQITKGMLQEFVNRQNIRYFEISAKTGKNINECFNYILQSVTKNGEKTNEEQQTIELTQKFFDQYDRIQNAQQKRILSCCYI